MLDQETTIEIFKEKQNDIIAHAREYDEKELAYELEILEGIAAVLGTSESANLVKETEKLAARKKREKELTVMPKIIDFIHSHRHWKDIELHAYTYLWEDEVCGSVIDTTIAEPIPIEEILDRARKMREAQKAYWHEHKSELKDHDLPIPDPCVYLQAYDENQEITDDEELILF